MGTKPQVRMRSKCEPPPWAVFVVGPDSQYAVARRDELRALQPGWKQADEAEALRIKAECTRDGRSAAIPKTEFPASVAGFAWRSSFKEVHELCVSAGGYAAVVDGADAAPFSTVIGCTKHPVDVGLPGAAVARFCGSEGLCEVGILTTATRESVVERYIEKYGPPAAEEDPESGTDVECLRDKARRFKWLWLQGDADAWLAISDVCVDGTPSVTVLYQSPIASPTRWKEYDNRKRNW